MRIAHISEAIIVAFWPVKNYCDTLSEGTTSIEAKRKGNPT